MPHVGSVQSRNRRFFVDLLHWLHTAHVSFAGLVFDGGAAAAVAAGMSAARRAAPSPSLVGTAADGPHIQVAPT
jgi:hypothetical protein